MVHGRAGVGVGRIVRVGVQQGLAGHGDDGGDHEVDGDHVGDALGHPRKLPEQPTGVGDDDRLGHAEPADPTGPRLGQGRLDDRGADHGDGDGVAVLGDQRTLAQRLRVRIGVRPAQRLGPGLADRDHLLLDPVLAQPFGPLRQQVQSGAPELLAGRLVELRQSLGPAGLRLAVAALAPGGGDLVAPVDLHGERVGVEQLLLRLALVGAGHVGGRHRHEVDRPAAPLGHGQLACGDECGGHPRGSEEVDLDGGVERGVEADGGGRVHDDVAVRQRLDAGGVHAQPVGGDVTGHRGDPGGHLLVEPVTQLVAQAVEAVVPQDLLGGPLHRRGTATGTDEQDDPAVGDAAQDALDQCGPEEPGGSGDEEAPAGEGVADAGHPICLPYGK